jgi:serine/threonine protein kinase
MRVNTLIEKDLENEIKVLDFLSLKDQHHNIIEILKHGWLQTSGKVYFIDMELADLSLADYIEYAFRNKEISSHIVFDEIFRPNPSRPWHDHFLVAWMIGCEIAAGLTFLHESHHVHRDLKPQNGIGLLQ